jgi:uncharacterized protein CbrC (UPF0167 family)
MLIVSINDIVTIFRKANEQIADKFHILSIPTNAGCYFANFELLNDEGHWAIKQTTKGDSLQTEYISKPGVYVLWKRQCDSQCSPIIKVGRHLKNTRLRAFQHLNADYTEFDTKTLKEDSEGRIILFNIKDLSERFWAAALEVYLEEQLQPIIKSKRL